MMPTVEVIYTDIRGHKWRGKRLCIDGFPTSNEVVLAYSEVVALWQAMHGPDYEYVGVDNPVTED